MTINPTLLGRGFQTTSIETGEILETLYWVKGDEVLVSAPQPINNSFDAPTARWTAGELPATAEFIGNYPRPHRSRVA